MSNYTRGRRFEHQVMAELERLGYWSVRSAGSKGQADIVALGPGRPLLIQCKAGMDGIASADWNALYVLACRLGATAIVARLFRGELFMLQVTGLAQRGSKVRPHVLFRPAPVEAVA